MADLLFEDVKVPLEEKVEGAAGAPIIFAVDPGPTDSAYVIFSQKFTGGRMSLESPILEVGIVENDALLQKIRETPLRRTQNVIFLAEQIEAMGMAVGREVFETVFWTGRFCQVWEETTGHPWGRVTRRQVKLQLCGSMQAKDPNIRQALIDRFGPPGTKKNPGKTYGVKEDIWSALAVAVTWTERREQDRNF